jgi:hypothetical protein
VGVADLVMKRMGRYLKMFVISWSFGQDRSLISLVYPRLEHLEGASLEYAPALLTNVRLSWKGLPGTKTHL